MSENTLRLSTEKVANGKYPDLISAETGNTYTKKTGGEYVGRALSAEDDRFLIWPDKKTGETQWHCPGACGKHGDDIQFVRDLKGLSYPDAVIRICSQH
ncbi:MAG: CHC2 zinc finger domain-containing protein [Desulfobacterales bacterium]